MTEQDEAVRHPRTYSLVGTPHLFLVTDDESGINIGYANKIGGPLVAPALATPPPVPAAPPHKDCNCVNCEGTPFDPPPWKKVGAVPAAPGLDVERLVDILDEAEGDGIIGPDYTPPRLAAYILDRLTEASSEDDEADPDA